MSSDKFCLKWNEFEINVSTAFRELRNDKDFFDVTLACDGHQLEAHKVIISACSPFFRNILKMNPHAHPLLYLKGIKYEDILAVLNFMYHGEVNIAQNDLNSFLAVAEDLQVKGLTQGTSSSYPTSSPKRPNERSLPPKHIQRQPPRHAYDPLTLIEQQCVTDLDEVTEVRANIKTETEIRTEQQSHVVDLAMDDHGDVEELDDEEFPYADPEYYQYQKEMDDTLAGGSTDPYGHLKPHCVRAKDGGYTCLLCSKKGRDMYHMRQHIESAHPELSPGYECQVCSRQFKNHNCWNLHMKKYH